MYVMVEVDVPSACLLYAEVIRRKWLEDNPEASTNEEPIVFDTSIIPWWAWVKRFHLPEAELLNGMLRVFILGKVVMFFVDVSVY